jgi:L-Ala-D/L-Glu epimerase
MILESLDVEPLFVALREPFVIANARMDTTRAGLVRAIVDGNEGFGESATLPPVTREDWPDVEATVRAASAGLIGARIATSEQAINELLEPLSLTPVARAGIETAILDALSRALGEPMAALFGARACTVLETDVTLPIAEPERMIELSREWRAKGFRTFKVKVGKDLEHDRQAIVGVHRAVPDARFRLDANEGFTADEALALLRSITTEGAVVECFEQPCRRVDLEGMAKVTREAGVPVIADEAVRSLDDLARVHAMGAASGVNLKLAKHGGPIGAYRIGKRARELGMKVMCGAMVETRLGLTAMAHVVSALGGADYVDLDTAFLLADDPFEGGFTDEGPRLLPTFGPGLDVRRRQR